MVAIGSSVYLHLWLQLGRLVHLKLIRCRGVYGKKFQVLEILGDKSILVNPLNFTLTPNGAHPLGMLKGFVLPFHLTNKATSFGHLLSLYH